MWKFVDSRSILHTQRQLIFRYSGATKGWMLDETSRYMVAGSLPLPATAKQVQKAITALELECNLWAYGRHPDREVSARRQSLEALLQSPVPVDAEPIRHAPQRSAENTDFSPSIPHQRRLVN